MAKQTINIGTKINSGGGDPLRTAFTKTNENFTELYTRITTAEGQLGISNKGGATIEQSIIGSVIGADSTVILDHTTGTITGKVVGDVTGSVVADDSTVLIDGVAGTINAGALTGALPAIDGSALTGISASSVAFSNITSKPTTLAGYGITDAATLSNMAPTGAVDFTGATTIDFNTVTINNLEFADISAKPTTLAGYGITDAMTAGGNVEGNLKGSVFADDSTLLVDGVAGTINGSALTSPLTANLTINSPVVTGIPDFTGCTIVDIKNTAVDFTGSTITGTNFLTTVAFADLTSKPTTLAGYGITDAASTGNTTFTGTIQFNETVKFEQGVTEAFGTYNNVSGVTVMDLDHGHLFYVTNATGDLTTNFTNLDMAAEYGTNITVIINQGATPYEVTAVQIGGAAQTINWQGGSQPTGNANGIDAFSFTILNDGGTYVVLGQMVDFT